MTLAAQAAVTPAGRPTAAPIPVAPVVACVIATSAVLIHSVGVDDAAPAVLLAVTVIVPVALTAPHPPVSGIVYANTPEAVGVPLIVMTLAAQAAVTPAGRPTAAPIPVAPVVACVIATSAVLIHSVGVDDAAPAVLLAVTVIVPVALTAPHPPVSGIVYVNTPEAVGVPLIVMTLAAQAAVTPAGKPTAAPIPVAPVVAWVIATSAVLIHNVGVDDAAPAVLFGGYSYCACSIDCSATSCEWYGVIQILPRLSGYH